MGRRRQKAPRTRRTSSADIGFGFLLIALGAVILVVGSALVAQVREADWRGAGISGGIIVVLFAIGLYSAWQRRRR
jgi:hypothetical protein